MSFKLTNHLFPRSFMRFFHLMPSESAVQPLIPYFQYKIGSYQKDHFLYFRREPSWLRYKCEAFDKMTAMSGYDILRFLDFHFNAYHDKDDFLRFMRYEITGQLAYVAKHPKYAVPGHKVILKWLAEKEALETAKTTVAPATNGNERVSDILEEKMAEVQRSFAGKIVIDRPQQMERFIQLLILLKELRAPGRSGEMLFSSFSTTDMAAILRQFTELYDYKTNTLQKKIAESASAMRYDEEANQLREALTRFFFEDTH